MHLLRGFAGGQKGVCSRCGPKLPVTDDGSCAQEGTGFASAFLPSFGGAGREAIHRYKISAPGVQRCGSRTLDGPVCPDALSGTFDLITWVPVSRKRRWERGFDQSGILAKEVARAYGGAAVQTLKKLRHIPPLSQTEGGEQRGRPWSRGFTACPVPGSCPAGGYCWWTM